MLKCLFKIYSENVLHKDKDSPKLNDTQFLFQVSIFDRTVMAAIFGIFGNGSHSRWLTSCKIED